MLKPKKTFSAAFLLIFIFSFFLQSYPAQAAFSWPSPTQAFNQVLGAQAGTQILNQIMGDMGVDKGETKNTVSQVNAQRQKQNPPEVSLSFFPANPSPGEEVTVTATPTYFASDSKNLYFTWYIKHHNTSLANDGNHDLNSDGHIDIEDYKIEAMRNITNGGWDWDPDGNGNPDGAIYASENDSDGYVATMGGEDQRNKGGPHCYIHNWSSGDDYELTTCEHVFADTNGNGNAGDGHFNLDEEQFWRTDPNNNDTAGMRQKDEATVSGLGAFEFKFNYQEGDKVGVAVEGASYQATDYRDSSYKIMWALVKNDCNIGDYIPSESRTAGQTTNNTTDATVAEGSVNMPASACTSFTYNAPGACQPNDLEYLTVATASPAGCTGGSPILSQSCSYGGSGACTSFTYGSWGACQPDGTQSREVAIANPLGCAGGSPVLTNSCTYTPSPPPGLSVSGDVLIADGVDPSEWPDAGYLRIDNEIIRYSTLSTAVSGGGLQFSNLQRGANGTAAASHADNAQIIGYTTTVDTEVITETTFNAQQNNFITTTTTNTTTTVTDVRGTTVDGPTTVSNQTEETNANSDSFSMPVSKINDCLESNMLSPAEGNAMEKLKVDLFYTPTAPMFSTNDDNADYLMLNSGLENASNEDYLIYDWKIYGPAFDPNPSSWIFLPKSSLPESTQTHGVGLKSLKFKLFFPGWGGSSVRYLKAKLTITEKRPDQTTETVKGNASVIIPIAPASTVLGIYSALPHSASPAPKVSLDGLRCDTGIQSAVCPVVKDEIVGLSIDPTHTGNFKDILWTVNGERISYAECFFDSCDPESQTDTMFIPILNDIGSKYTISATAINSVTGDKLNLTRTLVVTNPTMRIVSNDQGVGSTGARAVLLGTYIPIDPASTPTGPGGADELQDFSSTDFQALPGTQANFSMEFNVPNRFMDEEKTNWFLDGQDGSSFVTGSSLSFPVNKLVGESYSITTNSIYRQDPLIQQMLNHYWGVRIDQLYETQLSGKVDLSVVSVLNGQLAGADANQSLPRKMLAALSSGAPAYLLFLFRIVLTTGLLLFFIRLILSLVPKNYET
ncbi:MAG TPA: hypothetical protein VF390_00715 [Patescibacteria group bacterium]